MKLQKKWNAYLITEPLPPKAVPIFKLFLKILLWGSWGGPHENEDGDDNKDDNDDDNDNDNDNDVCKQQPLALSGSANYKILSPGLLFTILSNFFF